MVLLRLIQHIIIDMDKQVDKTVSFDQIPEKLKKKIRKRYGKLEKKHPGITEQQIMDKIGKKLNVKLYLDE
jgi:hypothetical protein